MFFIAWDAKQNDQKDGGWYLLIDFGNYMER